MNQELPTIFSAGLFESEKRFPNLSVTQHRTVKTYELEYFFRSGGTAVINGKAYPIKRGQVLFARPGDVRYSHLPFTCKFLHFTGSYRVLTAVLDSLPSVFPVADPKKAEELMNQIIDHFYSADPFDNLQAQAGIICLVHLLGSRSNEYTSTVTLAQRFIAENFQKPLTTQHIAHSCGVSSSYLHKLFKTVLGTTPGAYLLSCRISVARDLLANTDLPMSEIAFQCGFNSQSYFSDCFKRSVGASPMAFRKESAYLL